MLNKHHFKPGQEIPDGVLMELGDREIERLAEIKAIREIDASEPEEVAAAMSQPGKWNVDPATLKGLTLDKLNAMLISRGGEPEAAAEAAIMALSADFVPSLDSTPEVPMTDEREPA